MASLEVNLSGHDDLIKLLNSLETDDASRVRIINASAVPLEHALKNESTRHNRPGAMAGSIKPTDPKKGKYGDYYTVIRATGKDDYTIDSRGNLRRRKKPVRNMAKMAYVQYGTKHMTRDPIIERAVEESRNAVYSAMQSEYDAIINENGG